MSERSSWSDGGEEWQCVAAMIDKNVGITEDQAVRHVEEWGAARCRECLTLWKKRGGKASGGQIGPGRLVSMIRSDAAAVAAQVDAASGRRKRPATAREVIEPTRAVITTGAVLEEQQHAAALRVAAMNDAQLSRLAAKILAAQPAIFKRKFLEAQQHQLRTSPRWAIAFAEWFDAHPPKSPTDEEPAHL